ncbi:MAG: monovalent cation/H+ antiporter complex subunit F [Lachnospiraceae bacterium]|nr:monovalent cation/H+ antiporter complex subunit F [Lachnospiraceae bacterium]
MYILWAMLIFLIPYLVLIVRGPTVWDRILGMSLVSTKIIIIVIIFSSLNHLDYLTDFAIIYVLLGFIVTFFITTFLVTRKKREK